VLDPLVLATLALTIATLVLALVAWLQLRQMRRTASEETRQTETFTRQADLLGQSLEISRAMLDQARADREDAVPFTINVELHRDSVGGRAIFEFRNRGARGEVLRLRRVEIVEVPGEQVMEFQDLAEGTPRTRESTTVASAIRI
jgi:hypothetical protein